MIFNPKTRKFDIPDMITEAYLEAHPDYIFVFGDNLSRRGTGGAAKLRHCKNTWGFVTKKSPDHEDRDYYKPSDYSRIFEEQMELLGVEVRINPDRLYLISKLGGGIADRFGIFDSIISNGIIPIFKYSNAVRLW